MSWGVFTQVPGATFGSAGKAFWTAPTETFPIPAANFFEMTYPSSAAPMDTRPSWSTYEGRDYGVGGWTDNIVWTEHFEIVRQGMQAPSVVPTVALVAGPGITASVICYLSYFDIKTGERSSLSAPSATLAAANQQIQWSGFPTPLDLRVTHIELWRSVDGALPRLVMQRQLGVSTVTEAVAVGDLGETFVESFERFPRSRFNVIYHERQIMAGNDEHPDTLYLSLLNQPERWGGLTLRTRNGEPIVGLHVVRDRLFVQCPFSTYTVDGYTEDDLNMQIAQPELGALNHWSSVNIHGLLYIFNHLGLYVTDGSGWTFIADEVQTKWTDEYKLRRTQYEAGYAIHDPVSHMVLFYVGEHTDIPGMNVFWGADYEPVVSQVGGGFGQPKWEYDATARSYDSAAVLALPGGRRSDLYLGACDGFVRQANVTDYGIVGSADDDGDGNVKRMKVRHGANFMGDVGGNIAQGKRFTDLDVFVESEDNGWILQVFGGNEYAWDIGDDGAPQFQKNVLASASSEAPFGNVWEKKGTHPFKLSHLVGRAYTLGFTATSPKHMEYRGHQIYWKEGPAVRMPVDETSDPG